MRRFLQDSEGATAVEYGLIAGLVGLGMVGGLVLLGPSLSDTFNGVSKAQEKAVASVGSGSTSGGATLVANKVIDGQEGRVDDDERHRELQPVVQ